MKTEECHMDTIFQGMIGDREKVMKEINTRPDDQEKARFLAIFAKATDEQLCQYLRSMASRLGHLPRKEDVPAFDYIKKRLGPWPRALERAELKSVSDRHRKKLENKVLTKHMKKKRKHKTKNFREKKAYENNKRV